MKTNPLTKQRGYANFYVDETEKLLAAASTTVAGPPEIFSGA